MNDNALVFLQDLLEAAKDTDLAQAVGFSGVRRQGDALVLGFEDGVELRLSLDRHWDEALKADFQKAFAALFGNEINPPT